MALSLIWTFMKVIKMINWGSKISTSQSDSIDNSIVEITFTLMCKSDLSTLSLPELIIYFNDLSVSSSPVPFCGAGIGRHGCLSCSVSRPVFLGKPVRLPNDSIILLFDMAGEMWSLSN
jgi:hypothetical protein